MRGRVQVRALIGVIALASCALGSVAVAQTTDPPEPPVDPAPSTTAPPATSTTTPPPTTAPSTTPSTTPTTAPGPPPTPPGQADSVHAPTAAEDAAARAAFAKLTDEQRELLQRLQAARDVLAVARARLLDGASKVDAANTRKADADRDAALAADVVTQAANRLVRLQEDVAQLASAMYQHLGDSVLLDAVNTDDRNVVNRVRTYAKAPQAVLDTMVREARTIRHRLSEARTLARDAQAKASEVVTALGSLASKLRDAVADAEEASTEAANTVAAALGSNVALLAQVADPHFGADSISAVLAAAEAGAAEPATLFGAFRMPVPGAPLGSPYGIRVDPLSGSIGYHPGIDLEAAAGAQIHAAAAGVVVMAGDCGGYGNCVVLEHGHSLATVYAHQSRILVIVGQPVADGQVVGLVGSTGYSTGPHLHFEVRLHGAPIDPLPSLTN